MRISIIANPIAGGGRGAARSARLEQLLRLRGHSVDRYLTTKAGDARQRASELMPATELVIAVGGDGTLNEIINGLRDPAALAVTQLPMGTANIVAREFRLPFSCDELAEQVENFQIRMLDLPTLNGRRFIAISSSGLDAAVVREVTRSRKGKLGFLGYPLPLLRCLQSFTPSRMEITIDGQTHHGTQVFVGNIRTYAGFFQITDRAQPDSGLLDICIVPNGGKTKLMSLLWSGWRRTVSQRRDIIYRQGRTVRIESAQQPCPIEVDGDDYGDTPADITLQPRSLAFAVPAQ